MPPAMAWFTTAGVGTGTGNEVIINHHGYGYETDIPMHGAYQGKGRTKGKTRRSDGMGGQHRRNYWSITDEVRYQNNTSWPGILFNALNAEQYDRVLKFWAPTVPKFWLSKQYLYFYNDIWQDWNK